MGTLYIPVDLTDKEEKAFRKKAFERFDGKKGYLKKAAAEAFKQYAELPVTEETE